jgi:hypothetical protein
MTCATAAKGYKRDQLSSPSELLLLAISFAYQKDWLNLRKPVAGRAENSGASE